MATNKDAQIKERIRKQAISEIESAKSYDSSENAQSRERALEYYNGEQTDLPAPANRSKVKTTHTRDTVNYMMPQIMKVFFSGSEVVRVSPSGAPVMDPETVQQLAAEAVNQGQQPDQEEIFNYFVEQDKQEAKEASLYLNHLFSVEHDGYRIGWEVIQDALLMGNGLIKYYWDDQPDYEIIEHEGLSDEDYFALVSDDDLDITNHSETTETATAQVFDELGQVIGSEERSVTYHDVKARRVLTEGRASFVGVASEDFLIDSRATCIEDARFVDHSFPNATRSDLISMGHDKELVMSLSVGVDEDDGTDFARDGENGTGYVDEAADKSMQVVEYHECYMRMDVDDDGIAEVVRACIGGGVNGELLHWETLDDEVFPFADFNPERMAHRWRGVSVPDKTIDLDMVGTAVWRQVMDNLYATNSPQRQVQEDSVINPEALTSNEFGAIIFTRAGSQPINPLVTPFTAGQSEPMLARIDDLVTRGTGVDRNSAALNPEALNNQSATSANIAQGMAYSRIELVCRNFANGGFKQLFNGLLKLARKHQQYGTAVDDGGIPSEVIPAGWKSDMNLVVNVGLGSGSQEKDAFAVSQILNNQLMLVDRFAGAGMSEEALDMVPRVIDAMERQAEITGIMAPSQYFPDIDQADIDAKKQEAAAQGQQPDPEIELKREKMMLDHQLEKEKMGLDFQLRQQEMEMEAKLAAAKAVQGGDLSATDVNIRRG